MIDATFSSIIALSMFAMPATYTSRIIETEDGPAVLLPDEIAYPDDIEVTIVRSGDVLTVYPRISPASKESRLPGERRDPSSA